MLINRDDIIRAEGYAIGYAEGLAEGKAEFMAMLSDLADCIRQAGHNTDRFFDALEDRNYLRQLLKEYGLSSKYPQF